MPTDAKAERPGVEERCPFPTGRHFWSESVDTDGNQHCLWCPALRRAPAAAALQALFCDKHKRDTEIVNDGECVACSMEEEIDHVQSLGKAWAEKDDEARALKAKLDAARAGIEKRIAEINERVVTDTRFGWTEGLRFALLLLAPDAGATAGEDAVPHTRAFVESWEKEHGRSPERAPGAPTRGGEREGAK
jgi:hypothetical protein